MVECTMERAFEVLSIRIRTEMQYALDNLNKATSSTEKQQASNDLSEAVWNWEAYTTIWNLARGDEEQDSGCELSERPIGELENAN